MKRICIITPGQLGSNPRVVKEAETLSAAGYLVHVIATKVVDFVEPRDQAVLASSNFSVVRIRFDTMLRRRVERIGQIAARLIWTIAGHHSLAGPAHSSMARLLRKAALATPADLYIAHYVAALPAAAEAARRHNSRFAYDAEDFHLGDLPDRPEHLRDRLLIRAVESEYLATAAYVSAASPGISGAYSASYDIPPPTVILNAFSKKFAAARPGPSGTEMPGPTLYWFSQVIGPGRGLECAIEAISLAKSEPHLHLRGTPSRGYGDKLLAHANHLGVGDRLHFHKPENPDEMVNLAAIYDVGLVAETMSTVNRRIALTNKQFTYLLAGLPVVMSDIPAHVAFADEAEGAAFVYRTGDALSLATVLDALFRDPASLAAARSQAHFLGKEKLNWESEAPKLLACVRRAFEGRNQDTLSEIVE